MHALLRTLFAPLLNILEKGDEPYGYKPSHRKILLAVGALFLLLACVSLVCLVVGAVGSERAVAKLWGSRP